MGGERDEGNGKGNPRSIVPIHGRIHLMIRANCESRSRAPLFPRDMYDGINSHGDLTEKEGLYLCPS